MKFYENRSSYAWALKINRSKAEIEIKAQEIWMEQDFKMGLVHLFDIYWPYQKPKILLNYVNCVTFRFIRYIISQIKVIHDETINYILSYLMNDEIILDYSSLFNKIYCPDNPDNVRERFQRIKN